MKLKTIPLVIAAILPMTSIAATHTLDGTSLTVDKLWEISKSGEDVNRLCFLNRFSEQSSS